MMKVLQAGVSVEDFYSNSLRENMVIIKADRANQYREDKRLRLMLHTLSLPYVKAGQEQDIYDWMPLSGDPSKEEREKMKAEQDKKDEEKYLQLIKRVTNK
jgi:hypothetical protein